MIERGNRINEFHSLGAAQKKKALIKFMTDVRIKPVDEIKLND